jgi:hypothetical protein
MLSYLSSYTPTIQSFNNNSYEHESTGLIECEAFRLGFIKEGMNLEICKKLRDGQIQDLTRLINAWKNTPIRERAKIIIGSLVCFAAAVTLAIIAYHSFAFIIFFDPNKTLMAVGMAVLLGHLSLLAGFESARAGFKFACWAVCSTKRTITYFEQLKKGLEDGVEGRIRALKHLAEKKIQELLKEHAVYAGRLAAGTPSPASEKEWKSSMERCVNESMRIQTALSKIGITIPIDASAQQPVT